MNNDQHHKAYTLRMLRERLRDPDSFNYQDACRAADAIEELEDDANRYQWLRGRISNCAGYVHFNPTDDAADRNWIEVIQGEDLTMAIDDAREDSPVTQLTDYPRNEREQP